VKALKFEGRSIREIAVALKVPRSTVARALAT
jgi:DNA-directed RNA polymerase specialized sigma24 family protein